MSYRSLVTRLLAIFAASLGAGLGAYAAPSQPAGSIASPRPALLLRVGSGCGWDYPCAPEPDFGRRPRQRADRVDIQNNYGTVNVFVNGHRVPPSSWEAPLRICPDGPPPPGWTEEAYKEYTCGVYPREDNCGPFCWMRRFKRGYCGHGCEAYLSSSREVRDEERREEQEFERFEAGTPEVSPSCFSSDPPPPNCYRLPPPPDYSPGPPPPGFYRERRPVYWPERAYRRREERARELRVPPAAPPPARADEHEPRGRYEGPRYP
jgi:hypothetical protein